MNAAGPRERDGPTGRVKLGTESNGGFRNIAISNVVFERSRGLALETVDGGPLEDVTVSNITMRDVSNAPIFIRLGSRLRAPEGTPVGSVRRVSMSNIVAYDADPRYGSIISGIPGHDVEDIKLSDIRILYRGGLTLDQVAKQPAGLVNTFFFRASGGVPPREAFDTPEREKEYPEPSMFGVLPAYGFFIRHAKGVELTNVDVGFMQEDRRPAFVLEHVAGAGFQHVKAQKVHFLGAVRTQPSDHGSQCSYAIAGRAENRPWREGAAERLAALPSVRAHAVCFL